MILSSIWKVGRRLLPAIPGLSKKLLKGSGKKRIWAGAVTTAAGVGMFFIPGAQEFAVETTAAGALALSSGLINRYIFKVGKPLKNKEGVLMAGNINDTAEVLAAMIPLANFIARKLKGEKIGLTDATDVIAIVTKIPAAVENIADIPVELRDVDEDERAFLDSIIAELQVADKPAVAQHLLKAGVELGQAIALMTEKKAVG